MNQDLSNLYGRNLTFPASEFSKDMQEHIINNYFDGTGSAYDVIYNASMQQNGQQQPAQTLAQQPAQPVAPVQNQVQIDQAELDRLRGIEKYVQNAQPFNTQPQGMTPPPQAQNENNQGNTTPPLSDLEKLMQDLYSPGTAGTEPQQPSQQQPQNQANDPQQMLSEISRDAILAGVNPNDVVNYISTLSSKDIVNLFKAANAQQQPAQVQQPVQPVQQPVQQQAYQPNTFGQPQQQQMYQQPMQQRPINIVDMPSAQQSNVNLAFPPTQQQRSVFS